MRAFALGLLFVAQLVDAQINDHSEAIRLVRTEVLAELAIGGLHPTALERVIEGLDSAEIVGERATPEVEILRIRPAAFSHWHRYTVAHVGGEYYRLGGFHDPDVLEFAAAMYRVNPAMPTALSTREWYELLDPMGADRIHWLDAAEPPADAVLREAATEWRARRGSPAHALVSISIPGYRIEVLSALTRRDSSVPFWVPVTTALVFTEKGQLASWRQSVGAALGAASEETR